MHSRFTATKKFEITFTMRPSQAILLNSLLFCLIASGCTAQPETNALQLIKTIPLPDVNGRIDHLSFDKKNNHVFVAALGNNSIEIIDIQNNKIIHSITDLHEPQGVAYIPGNNSVFIANGENGECDIFNAATFQKTNVIKLAADADNVRYVEAANKIYVGYGTGGIAIIDATTFRFISEIKLPAHPESFQIDQQEKKMYVNVPDKKEIDVIDLLQNKIISQWKITAASANFPMALDEADHRIFIGCRHPSKLLVLDTETGKMIASFDIDSDTDDIFYDATAKAIYVTCGSGYVNVFDQKDADHYSASGKAATYSGARTSLFIPKLHQLIVAAPARFGRNAQLMIYKTK